MCFDCPLVTASNNLPFPEGDCVTALLMSGGVDSSVAALLLKEQGRSVVGFTMCIPDLYGNAVEQGTAAAQAAAELNIPHFIVHSEQFFAERIMLPFREEYLRGRTPNPCVDCNAKLKLGLMVEVIDFIAGRVVQVATGHYARILQREGKHYLAAAANLSKDQSYFLCDIKRDLLSRLAFPLGQMDKSEVRAFARKSGLAAAERNDSMEICFMREGDYRPSVKEERCGNIVDKNGKILGRHAGISGYTVGQRKGLGIASKEALYVAKIDMEHDLVFVGGREDVYTNEVQAESPNVLAPEMLHRQLYGKTRSRSPLSACKILLLTESNLSVVFDTPQFAPAAGQRLALYDSDGILVVAGVICLL